MWVNTVPSGKTVLAPAGITSVVAFTVNPIDVPAVVNVCAPSTTAVGTCPIS